MSVDVKISKVLFDKALDEGMFDNNPLLPIFQAVRDGHIQLLTVLQANPGYKPEAFKIRCRNCVIQIGDDFAQAFGPTAAFDLASMVRALRRCKGIVLQVAAYEPEIVSTIATMATLAGPIMIIETREEREIEWIKFLQEHDQQAKCPVLIMSVRQQPS